MNEHRHAESQKERRGPIHRSMLSGRIFGAFSLLLLVGKAICFAHDQRLHMEITRSAFLSSDGLETFLGDVLGTQSGPFTTGPTLIARPDPFTVNTPFSPLMWMEFGAYYQDMLPYFPGDPGARGMEHF